MLRSSLRFLTSASVLPPVGGAAAAAVAATPAKRVIRVGDSYSVRRTFTADDVATFAKVTGDCNPIHVDDAAARRAGFDRAIVHGQLVGSLFSFILGVHLPGPHSVYVHQEMQFLAPVLVGEEVEATIRVLKFRKDKGLIDNVTEVVRVRDGVVVIKGKSLGMNRAVALEGESPPWKSGSTSGSG